MKKLKAGVLNRIAVAILLLASAGFHVLQALKTKKNEISFNSMPDLTQSVFPQSTGFSVFIFPKQNLINQKPIYLCVK